MVGPLYLCGILDVCIRRMDGCIIICLHYILCVYHSDGSLCPYSCALNPMSVSVGRVVGPLYLCVIYYVSIRRVDGSALKLYVKLHV